MTPAPTAREAERALARLKMLLPAQAIRDPELNRALAPFRGHPPTALLCGNPGCRAPLLWCALDPLTARVRFGATGPGDGAGAAAESRPAAALRPSRRRPAPYDRWRPSDEAGEPVVLPGEPLLRWRFRCRRCGRPCLLTNARMITMILRALATGRTSIRPAAE